MAPPGPPPYTIEQINAMSTKEERLRARAELNSYIARMKKEQQDRLARSANGYTAHDGGAASAHHGHTSAYVPRGRGAYNNTYRGGPQRGAAPSTEAESVPAEVQEITSEALNAPQMFTQQVDYVPFDVED
ncbi:hypothetical protein E8E11_002250 [Didymella keratinophila]|nr:hypothetical protein E8E11_002250 [Didymella keratinophila]